MADEDQQSGPVRGEQKMMGYAPIMMKVFEVIFAVFAIGLVADPLKSFQKILIRTHFKLDDAAIIYISLGGYVIINTMFIICQIMGDQIPKRTLIMFSALGALLHVVAGSVIVYNWKKIMDPYFNNEIYPSKQYMDMFISGAVFTFVDAVIFILEIFIIIKISTKTQQ